MMSINCIHRFPLPAVLLYKIMQEYTVSEEFLFKNSQRYTINKLIDNRFFKRNNQFLLKERLIDR